MIYLDSSAITKPYPEVTAVITDILTNHWGNPSSNNSFSDYSRMIVEEVRTQIAEDINCQPEEIIFTSSGSESNSLALMGFLEAHNGYELYTSYLEHASISALVDNLPSGVEHVRISNNSQGFISKETLRANILKRQALVDKRPLVSIAFANSDIGVIQDIKTLAEVVHSYGGVIHCDAVQMFAERKIDVQELGIDMMSVTAQKWHGPNVGFLYVRSGTKLRPIVYGTQNEGLKGGTYPTCLIAGMGEALKIMRERNTTEYVGDLRNKLADQLLQIPNTRLNGPEFGPNRMSNNISLTIDGVDAEQLMVMCDLSGIIIAKGSACKSYSPEPSLALLAIGLTHEQALSTIRISLDEFVTLDEINTAAQVITKLVERIRCN